MTPNVSGIQRVPTLLASSVMRTSIGRTSGQLFGLQSQLSSGLRVQRPSDDPVAAATLLLLEDVAERRTQRVSNLSHADSTLGVLDGALGQASEALLEVKGIASSQIGVGSDAETREAQATVIDAVLEQLRAIANTKYLDLHLFGGTATGAPPLVGLDQGLRYVGERTGFRTDLGVSESIPITLGGQEAFGSLSSRVGGARDLDPAMRDATLLADLGGARGIGVGLGTVQVTQGGTTIDVDLTGLQTIGEVAAALETEIQASLDAGATVSIDAATGNRLEIIPTGGDLTVSDPLSDATAADLGLAGVTFTDGVGATGDDLDPKVTLRTQLADLTGVTAPLGTIRIENIGRSRDLDLSGAATVEDLVNLVEGLDLGVRVEVAASGDRLDFVNELSGGDLSIGEVSGGSTATELGVRSFAAGTLLADFNDGRGVSILSGNVDPVSGLPDASRDLDFRVTLKDDTEVDVDLAGATTVQDALDAINAAAAAAGLVVGVDFEARLAADGNGIEIDDTTNGGVGTTAISRLNGSTAADDLGIAGSTDGATLTGEDRAKVAVESVFTHLMQLRDALRADDQRGIALAGEKLESDLQRVAQARAEVGVRARRVADATEREEDARIRDEALMSRFRDLDFTEAAIRYGQLETQLQAGMLAATRASSLSLLDFLR